MAAFDPNAPAAAGSGIFGLPFSEAEAALVLLPVPWEATTSYGGGTSEGPRAILAASHQVDLYDLDVERPYQAGIHMLAESSEVRAWNGRAKALAARVIEAAGTVVDAPELEDALRRVNAESARLDAWVEAESERILGAGKLLGVVGGDHSVPLGALRAVARRERQGFGVLHFDAHSDTRDAYEGFLGSHASIMRNVLETIPEVTRLVQVGIRDLCEEEVDYMAGLRDRAVMFTDRSTSRRKLEGEAFGRIAAEVVSALPERVWISFDIDGLDPRYCPHTGTPVPGGLELAEAVYLMGEVVRSGRTLLGFDLDEVAPDLTHPDDEWDANVGARLLYKLSGFLLASQGRASLRSWAPGGVFG